MPGPQPAISVVIPTHNRLSTLPRAIQSVLGQGFPDFELIIVDDGSTDGTAEYLRTLTDPRLRVIAITPCGGANPARNAGIAAARADIVTFLDSDDIYLDNRLEAVVAVFAARPDVELLLSSFITIEGTRRTSCVNPRRILDAKTLEEALVAHSVFIAGSSITARKATLLRAGAFDPEVKRMQDRDLLLRIARFAGAALGDTVDWHKFTTPGAISYSKTGYLHSLAELIARHPIMTQRYSHLVRYLVARPILTDFLQGDLANAYRGLSIVRNNAVLRSGGSADVRGYLAGKRARRILRAKLAAASQPGLG